MPFWHLYSETRADSQGLSVVSTLTHERKKQKQENKKQKTREGGKEGGLYRLVGFTGWRHETMMLVVTSREGGWEGPLLERSNKEKGRRWVTVVVSLWCPLRGDATDNTKQIKIKKEEKWPAVRNLSTAAVVSISSRVRDEDVSPMSCLALSWSPLIRE